MCFHVFPMCFRHIEILAVSQCAQNTLKTHENTLDAHWRHIVGTLKHIETHYNQGNFYVVVATITTMCFNVFQCAKNTLKTH